jgi:hypothetical protein
VIAEASSGALVYLELGAKRIFACALDWPGWCRSGRTEEQALDNLAEYAQRYAPVAAEAGFPNFLALVKNLIVVERLPGNATTDFGAPDAKATRDAEPLSEAEAGRIARLVAASWRTLGNVVEHAPPELRKGPRGGGRDRDPIVQHVINAEAAYARKLGLSVRQPVLNDQQAVRSMRDAILEAIRRGSPPAERGWPVPYAARRIAWHVLDHAWEIEDRAAPASPAA